MDRIERRLIQSLGWAPEMLGPSKIGGASGRVVQGQIRTSIKHRQRTLKKRASRLIGYAVSVAMKNGDLPRNSDWFKFSLQMPAQLSVDEGYSKRALLDDLRIGLKSEADVAALDGIWYEDTRKQRKLEVDSLLTDAAELSKKHNIPLQSALDLLQQRTPNPPPIPPEETQTGK